MRAMKNTLLLLVAGSAFFTMGLLSMVDAASGQNEADVRNDADALDEALAQVGMARADLGWTPKSWWPRYPEVPYKLRSFDRLFAVPLECVAYDRVLAETAYRHLDPETIDQPRGDGGGQLFQAVQRLGIDPRFGGFRGYNANLVMEKTPLADAILELTRRAGRPTTFTTFGSESPYPKIVERLPRQTAGLPARVDSVLGQLVLNVAEAHHWAELAFRSVDAADRLVVARRFNLGEELIDALDYCPEVDDVARAWDEASLWYAGQKCVEALDDTRKDLRQCADDGELADLSDFAFDWQTPWGWIRIRGTGDDEIDGDDSLLIVDLGGDDRYAGAVAASQPGRPIGLLLDLAGKDRYESETPAQGAGLTGVGVLLDAAGNDEYHARHYAQGAGQFGLGVCIDLAGDDRYLNRFSGQGCGYFGCGLLLDVGGEDRYTLHAEGQGFGGAGGVGVLADRDGDDEYTAVRQHSLTGRPSYHSPELDVAVSNAQGCGMGRRGDGGDGHSWAGGLGALFDGGGDDIYHAGNWSMGTGYWFGIGLLHDAGGNDEYHGVAWSQGTGAHFCIGICIDEAGDDKHLSEENSRLSLALAHDFTVGILLDGSGNDLYSVDGSGLGESLNRSVSMLLDLGGDDTYRTKEIPRPGNARNSETFRARSGVGTYFADTSSIGMLLDIGGRDSYWGELHDDMILLDEADSPNWVDRNFSIFVDRGTGHISFEPVPVRLPSLVK